MRQRSTQGIIYILVIFLLSMLAIAAVAITHGNRSNHLSTQQIVCEAHLKNLKASAEAILDYSKQYPEMIPADGFCYDPNLPDVKQAELNFKIESQSEGQPEIAIVVSCQNGKAGKAAKLSYSIKRISKEEQTEEGPNEMEEKSGPAEGGSAL